MKILHPLWVALLLLVAAAGPANAAPTFPPLASRVVDQAGILSAETEAGLAARLEVLEQKTSRQLVVVTVPSLQGYEIEEFGYQLGRTWGIGEERKDNGVLLLVAPTEQKVRIEVGYGLEPILTDALASSILQTDVLPRFRSGDLEDGVVAGVERLIEQLSLPRDEAEARANEAASSQPYIDPLTATFLLGIGVWVVVGLISSTLGGGGGYWLWPLLFMMRHSRHGSGNGFRGGGGSFGGGGASGRW
ncbi:conserved exported hypothetical protein [uncultured Defluviicoccus sp.]|uniref:TPM domain-containing protein n=1 Tax=metagenome TaxID=256318 RepID=A0A380T849_9ZZZZ|nr:conserved exported hypothetical protein [uncultured Defluviicoccus sp.]